MTVYEACKKLRKSHGITQELLSNMSGISRATISGFEHGRVKSVYVAEMYYKNIGDIEVSNGMMLSQLLPIMGGWN